MRLWAAVVERQWHIRRAVLRIALRGGASVALCGSPLWIMLAFYCWPPTVTENGTIYVLYTPLHGAGSGRTLFGLGEPEKTGEACPVFSIGSEVAFQGKSVRWSTLRPATLNEIRRVVGRGYHTGEKDVNHYGGEFDIAVKGDTVQVICEFDNDKYRYVTECGYRLKDH